MRIGEFLKTWVSEANLKSNDSIIMDAQKNLIGRVVYFSEDVCIALRVWPPRKK